MTALLINLYRQAEDYFFRGISSQCLNLADGANAYMTGVPVADLNLIYIRKMTNTLNTILNEGQRFFDHDSLPFTVIIPTESCVPAVESTLSAMNYSQIGKSVCMGLKLETITPHDTTHFSDSTFIQANDNKLDEWMIPLIDAFVSTFDLSLHYANTHESALSKKVELHHFSLYKKSQPVASITLSLQNEVARIDDVGTLPEYQAKGYATRLMTFVLSEARKLGAQYCFLEASDSGFSIYQKLGFEMLFKNNSYSRKA